MTNLALLTPWLAAMLVLLACSAFFSGAEAALFSLRDPDRRRLAEGGAGERLAGQLLARPEYLLSAILLWNLVVNVSYFSISSVVALRIAPNPAASTAPVVFAGVSLLLLMFLGEMLPKSVGVLAAKRLAGRVSWPLSWAVWWASPLLPALNFANLLSRRLVWPRFQPEPYLEIADLERAISLSNTDAQLIEQEQAALRNIVLLSEIRVDEWMRPRTQFLSYKPPVNLADLNGKVTPSGYLLLTEPDGENVESALALKSLFDVPTERLDHLAEPVVYVPWCATIADALQEMQDRGRRVTVVVNEYGETIGVLTFEDVLDTVFAYHPSRSRLVLGKKPIHDIDRGIWLVAGITGVKQLERYLGVQFPASKSVTIAGVIQETLGRLAQAGDECQWGEFRLRVLEAPQRGLMLVEVIQQRVAGASP